MAGGARFDAVIDVTAFHTNPAAQFGTVMPVKERVFRAAAFGDLIERAFSPTPAKAARHRTTFGTWWGYLVARSV